MFLWHEGRNFRAITGDCRLATPINFIRGFSAGKLDSHMAASCYKQKQKQKSVNVCTVCSRKHCLQLSQALGWVFFLMPIHRFSLKFRHKQEANFRDFKLGETECHCTTLTSSTCSGLLFCFSFAPFLPSFLWETLLTPMLRPAYDFFLLERAYLRPDHCPYHTHTRKSVENTLWLTYNLFNYCANPL